MSLENRPQTSTGGGHSNAFSHYNYLDNNNKLNLSYKNANTA